MDELSWSDDARLGDLFQPSDEAGDNQPMSDDLPITMQQLAVTAGRFFKNASLADTPAKLWLDCYYHSRPAQLYLRATFDAKYSGGSLIRLAALKSALEAEHRVKLVAVAYADDMPWEDAEAINEQLNGVF